MMMYENKGYDKKKKPKLLLNKLKIIRSLTPILPHWGLRSRKIP